MNAIVVGAGWAGVAAASELAERGIDVEVLESGPVVGGHSRMETLCGITYESNGPHVLHTSKPEVIDWLMFHGLDTKRYLFCPMTEIDLGDETRFMSWPIQLSEVEELPCWPTIKAELSQLPLQPGGPDLESWCISLMGPTLYRLYIEGYTRKQWGCEPRELSASIGPKRIELRRHPMRALHRDRWQFFPSDGVVSVMEAALRHPNIIVTCGAGATAADLADAQVDGFVVTAALDEFLDTDPLPWRGVHLRSTFYPQVETITPAHVVNRPSSKVPYTRTIETKHASGTTMPGTVVSYEFPGAAAKHYPVPTPGREHETRNEKLQVMCAEWLGRPTAFAGRLATYRYIDQDDAIISGWGAGHKINHVLRST